MKQGNIRETFAKKIGQQSLTKEQLAQLGSSQAKKPKTNNRLNYLAVAVVTLLISFIVVQQTLIPHTGIEQKIANEVAKNHIKLKPLEVHSAQLEVLRAYFTELDFSPIASTNINFSTQSLIGGRYCSIQGITVAQLRLKNNETGQLQSLYQTLYDRKIFTNLPDLSEGQQPITVHANGISVDIWVEKGLLFALTKDE